jgi:hypothetical protein
MDHGENVRTRVSRWLFRASCILLSVFAVDVIAGKIAEKFGVVLPFRLDDVGEFLVVMACVVCFVGGMLIQESEDIPVE